MGVVSGLLLKPSLIGWSILFLTAAAAEAAANATTVPRSSLLEGFCGPSALFSLILKNIRFIYKICKSEIGN